MWLVEVRSGAVGSGKVWSGGVRYGSCGLVRRGPVGYGTAVEVGSGLARPGSVRFGKVS